MTWDRRSDFIKPLDVFLMTWWPWKPVQLDGHLDLLHVDASDSERITKHSYARAYRSGIKSSQSRWPADCTGFHGHHIIRNSSEDKLRFSVVSSLFTKSWVSYKNCSWDNSLSVKTVAHGRVITAIVDNCQLSGPSTRNFDHTRVFLNRAVCITSLNPKFNGSHFVVPPSSITRMTGWVANYGILWRMRTAPIHWK